MLFICELDNSMEKVELLSSDYSVAQCLPLELQ